MRLGFLAAAVAAALMVQASAPAYAGLDGSTVDVAYWYGSTASPPSMLCVPSSMPCEVPPGLPASPALVPVMFNEGATSGVQISVDNTQIVITDVVSGPFCVLSTVTCPGPDVFNGFSFVFSGGEIITGVSVDPTSTADFRPLLPADVTFTSTEIFVNVAGLSPGSGDVLTLDVNPSTTPSVPELSAWALMLLGFAGLGSAGYRRMGDVGRAERAV